METIYVIEANFSDYESCPEIVGWVETKDLAEKKVQEMNKNLEIAKEYNDKIWDYRDSIRNTIEKEQNEIVPQFPKWKAGIHQNEITKEMRDERNRIQKEAEEVLKRNDERDRRFQDELDSEVKKFMVALNISEEIMKEIEQPGRGWYQRPINYIWEEVNKL